MKKLNFIAVAIFVLLLLSSCAGMPDFSKEIDPLVLFNEDAAIYAQLKVQDNEDLFRSMLSKNILEIDKNSLDIIVEKSHSMYFAIYDKNSKKGTSTDVVVQGMFPPFYLDIALNPLKGWEEKTETVNGKEYKYKEHITGIKLAVISTNYIVLSTNDVTNLQYRYDTAAQNTTNWPIVYTSADRGLPVNEAFQESKSFTLYFPKAKSLLSSAFDIPLEIAAVYAYGSVRTIAQDDYNLDLQLKVEESKLLKGTMALLKLATMGTELKLDLINDDVITVSNLPFDAFSFFN